MAGDWLQLRQEIGLGHRGIIMRMKSKSLQECMKIHIMGGQGLWWRAVVPSGLYSPSGWRKEPWELVA